MNVDVDPGLRAGDVSFRAADAALLQAVAEAGSVSGASESLGRSRARALKRIETLEAAFGSLVDRERGGAAGGGSTLTPVARELIARFERLRATLAGTATAAECVLDGTVVDWTAELCVAETAAGEVRARFVDAGPEPLSAGPDVEVSIRSDTVTLQRPPDAPDADATSARNRLAGQVVDVDAGDGVGRVTLDIGAAEDLVALLTAESLDRLALDPGDDIVASFKATATRALPVARD